MKQKQFLKHLRTHGCYLKREGRSHSLWCNPANGKIQAIPRHTETSDLLVKRICKQLEILLPQ